MQPQLHTILQDLNRNGITDALSDTPFDWSVRPQRAPRPTAAAPLAPAPKLAPQAAPEVAINPEDYLRTHGQAGAALTIVTANLPQQSDGLPFTEAEKTLLTNILRALNISIDNINLATVTATTDENIPLTPTHIKTLHQTATEQLAALKPQKILAFGQLASSVYIAGSHIPLTALRTKQPQAFKIKDAPTVTTYHPRHLLKTPLLKQCTWQDIQTFLNE